MSASHSVVCPERGFFLVVQFLEEEEYVAFLELLEGHGYVMGFDHDYTFGGTAVAFHKIATFDQLKPRLRDFCLQYLLSVQAWVVPQNIPWAVRIKLLKHHVGEMDEHITMTSGA